MINRDELLNNPVIDPLKQKSQGDSKLTFYDLPLNSEEIDFLLLNKSDYIVSAYFYISVPKIELIHPRWWQLKVKAKIRKFKVFEWVRKSISISEAEYNVIQDGMALTVNGWMLLKALGNIDTFNIRYVQIETASSIYTQYIKTENDK